ncbi:unnamed protein product [Cuscuta campestris]|uniref:Uncharacterized protein n=1 Tax=Cuscuta campestris TaxID=132261 RepID=A0A484LXW5_9ASTE|nr:unnamed protein product [Cuscuta campestris]
MKLWKKKQNRQHKTMMVMHVQLIRREDDKDDYNDTQTNDTKDDEDMACNNEHDFFLFLCFFKKPIENIVGPFLEMKSI